MSAKSFMSIASEVDRTIHRTYTGTIVTRCRTTGHVDAFSMSGYRSFDALVKAFAERARYTDLVAFTGVCVEDCKRVTPYEYTASELRELVEAL